jgi:hypothetical protein
MRKQYRPQQSCNSPQLPTKHPFQTLMTASVLRKRLMTQLTVPIMRTNRNQAMIERPMKGPNYQNELEPGDEPASGPCIKVNSGGFQFSAAVKTHVWGVLKNIHDERRNVRVLFVMTKTWLVAQTSIGMMSWTIMSLAQTHIGMMSRRLLSQRTICVLYI